MHGFVIDSFLIHKIRMVDELLIVHSIALLILQTLVEEVNAPKRQIQFLWYLVCSSLNILDEFRFA
jgi:uncharacterized membrane protein